MHNIVLIAIDTQRPDHLGCYGYDRPTSPRLDAFAAAGATFEALWSASNFTAPAFTSLFTGQYPNHHGVFNFQSRAESSPVSDCLKANGVRMGGAVAFRFFNRLLGKVWSEVEAVTDTRSFNYDKRLPAAVSDAGIEWLQAHGHEGPFALFLHFDGPHMPYRLPDEHAHRFGDVSAADVPADIVDMLFPQHLEVVEQGHARRGGGMFALTEAVDRGRRRLDDTTLQWMVDRYDDSVFYNDQQVGRVFDALEDLNLADDTVVCVISDHGEELMGHGHLSHAGIHLYDDVIRTVGLVRGPGLPAGRRIARPTSHVQLWPWLLRLAGADHLPTTWQVLDLLNESLTSPVFCVGEFKAAVRCGDHKLIRRRIIPQHGLVKKLRLWAKMALLRELGDELFDMAADPAETMNLASERSLRDRMRRLLDEHLASPVAAIGLSTAADLDAAEKARIEKEMKDLGYM